MAIVMTTAHKRIASLLDEGSFIELGAYVCERDCAPSREAGGDGVVTGCGTIEGAQVFVYAQNPDYKGGSVGEMHARKITALYRRALQMGAPVIALIDTAGIRLQEDNDSLFSFGKILSHQSEASGVIPQIALVLGTCGGSMAVSARMCDFVLMDSEHGKLFFNSPNAITGSFEEKLDTSSAVYHTATSGSCDFSGSQEEIFAAARKLVSILPHNNEQDFSADVCGDDLNRATAGLTAETSPMDILREISDDGFVCEPGAGYLKSMRTAFIRINGRAVGAVANSVDQLCNKGSMKAAKFLRFCDAFGIPVLTLANVRKLRSDEEIERGLGAALPQLAHVYAAASVPKVTLVTGNAFGTAGLMMGSKALGADLAFAWKDAKAGAMEEELRKDLTGADAGTINGALFNACRGYFDDIIHPMETRQRLAAAFEMLYSKCTPEPLRRHSSL